MSDPYEFDDPAAPPAIDPDPRDPAKPVPYGPERLGYHDPTHAKKIEQREQAARILDLRLRGRSVRQIAKELGKPEAYVANLLRNEVNRSIRRNAMSADQLRDMQLRRLDMVIDALHEKVMAGDWKATDMYMKVMERQARLTGIDAPEQTVSLNLTAQLSDAEILDQARLHGLQVPAGSLSDKPPLRVRAVAVTDGDGTGPVPGPAGLPGRDEVRGQHERPGPGPPGAPGLHPPLHPEPGVPADPPGDG